jgi:hypothetical protein
VTATLDDSGPGRTSRPLRTRPDESWPALPLADWQPTRDTLHLWTQVVGKTRLALAPPQNHWWNVPLYVDVRGLTTSLMPLPDGGGLQVDLDLRDHVVDLVRTDGRRRRMRLEPRTVADFHAEYLTLLEELDVDVTLNPMPTEIAGAVPFPDDTTHASYDREAVEAFWRSLVSAHRVLGAFRSEFRGKCSPVHFFWGAFDLAVTRFSGRPAPVHPGGVPHCPDWVMVEAYNAEVSSCGYWPGGAEEGLFYAYAYPEPPGFADGLAGAPGHHDAALGEYVLPYADVRRADDPDELVATFLRAVHARAAADWPLSGRD